MQIKKFTTHGTVANLPGCGRKRKIDARLQRRIVRMLDKLPRTSSKRIEDTLQAQGASVSTGTTHRHLNKMECYGGPGGPHCWHRDIKKPEWSLPKCMWVSQNPSGKMSCGLMRPRYSFLVRSTILLFICYAVVMRPTKKSTLYPQLNMEEGQRCFGVVLLPLALVPCTQLRHHDIWRLSGNFRSKHRAQCQKAGFSPKVIGLPVLKHFGSYHQRTKVWYPALGPVSPNSPCLAGHTTAVRLLSLNKNFLMKAIK